MQENMKSGKLRQEGTKGEEKVGSFAEEKNKQKGRQRGRRKGRRCVESER